MATKATLEKWFTVANMVWSQPIGEWSQREEARTLSRCHSDLYGTGRDNVSLITLCVTAAMLADEEDAVCMCGDLIRTHTQTSGHTAQTLETR